VEDRLAVDGHESLHVAWVGTTDGSAPVSRLPRSQRILDVGLILLLSPIAAVVAIAIAIAIYLDSPGPVIYRSQRIGRAGDAFAMLKFRKMRQEVPALPLTLEQDERFTPIGRFLSATRLDELPQLVNVLRGEMRLVGPRPELAQFVARYRTEYAEILTVAPGLTGEAQLRFLDERRLLAGPEPEAVYTETVLPAKIQIDLRYVRRHTLVQDVWILLRTAALPFGLLLAATRTYRRWLPMACAGVAFGLLFVLLSNSLP
jgi:lipopolysaccharide/colanic/teichoic acid biosynthesis glycosyltransferase